LLVVAADEATAKWAGRPIDLGASNCFTPFVIGPSGVPWVTSEQQARDDPELAVLSAMAHGKDPDTARSVQVAIAAQLASLGLDEERSKFYCDLIQHALSEAARRALQTMDLSKYEYQSEFAKRYVAQGREEGREEGLARGRSEGGAAGRADLLGRLLAHRFGPLPGVAHGRLAAASIEELDAIGERLLTARSLPEALG
jgi:flagellar biosynthesis/type III secretory pathway protein FliH